MRRIILADPIGAVDATSGAAPSSADPAANVGLEGPDPSSVQLEPGTARLRGNVLANVGYFVFSVCLSLWFTAFLIRKLGVSAYGLVPLATSVTTYVGILTIAISGSVGRFVTTALAQGDDAAANRTFNTALFASLTVAALVLPLLALAAFAAPFLLDVPAGHENGARWLLLGTFSAFLVTTVGSNFAVSSFARSRFDLSSAIACLSLVVRVGGVAVFFSLLTPQLWHVATAVLVAALVALAGSVWTWRTLTPSFRIRLLDFHWTLLRAMASTGGWLILIQTATLLLLYVDLVLVNLLAGAEAAGSYAPVLQMSRTLLLMATIVASVLTPTILGRHARGDTEGMVRLCRQAVKILGLCMALPIGLLCGLAGPFLQTWLGDPFGELAPLVWLLVGPLCINVTVLPLFSLQLALDKVRSPGIVSLVLGVGNLALAVALAAPLGWGMYGVAAAGAIMLTVKNAVYTPLYCARILDRPLATFFGTMTPSIAAAALVAAAAMALSSVADLASWPRLACSVAAISALYAPLAFFVLLRRDERHTVRSIIVRRTSLGQ